MPCLIITGHPCVGKTTFSTLLAKRALSHPSISKVVTCNEASACPDTSKAACYSNSGAEKVTRAALKSEFDRAVMSCEDGGRTLVILDSMNYIKGYRYELYCISKAAGEQHACIWVMGSPSDEVKSSETSRSDLIAKERNIKRRNGTSSSADCYEDDVVMDELVLRFEPPDQSNRWESPLYKVDLSSVLPWSVDGTKTTDMAECDSLADGFKTVDIKAEEKPKKSSARFKRGKKSTQRIMTSTMDGQNDATNQSAQMASVPLSMASRNLKVSDLQGNNKSAAPTRIEDVVDSVLDSFLSSQRLKEGMSTLQHVSAESNSLNEVDSIANKVNQEILKAQDTSSLMAGVGGKIFVPLANGNRRALNLSKPLRSNELRDFRRQFLKWIAAHPLPDGTREEETIEVYISYIANK